MEQTSLLNEETSNRQEIKHKENSNFTKIWSKIKDDKFRLLLVLASTEFTAAMSLEEPERIIALKKIQERINFIGSQRTITTNSTEQTTSMPRVEVISDLSSNSSTTTKNE